MEAQERCWGVWGFWRGRNMLERFVRWVNGERKRPAASALGVRMRPGTPPLEKTQCLICATDGIARSIHSHRNDLWLRRIGMRYRCRWVMCMGCGLLYQHPRPTPECMELVYATAYRTGPPSEEYLGGKRRDAEERLEWIIRFLGHEGAHRLVLDVGCSEGSLLGAFKERGWEVYGVEPTPSFAHWGRERYRVPIHIGSFDESCYPDTRFDLIVLSHVLEHIHDPDGFMKLVVKRLASYPQALPDPGRASGPGDRIRPEGDQGARGSGACRGNH